MATLWDDLRIHAETSYIGAPPRHGNGVWTAPFFHSTWYLLSGTATVERAGVGWSCGPGEGMALPTGWRRWQAFSAGSQVVSLGLSVAWPDGGDALHQDEPVVLSGPPAAELAGMAQVVVGLTPDAADAAGVLRRRSAVLAYAARWLEVLLGLGCRLRQPGEIDPRLVRLRTALGERPRLGPIDWPMLARATGLSRAQLDRLSRAAWGMPVRGCRDRLVAARVRDLLAVPGHNLAGIAAAVGATDASHLVKWFKRCTGRTPGVERRGL